MLHRLKMRFVRWCFDQLLDDGEPVEVIPGPRLRITSTSPNVRWVPSTSTAGSLTPGGTCVFTYEWPGAS